MTQELRERCEKLEGLLRTEHRGRGNCPNTDNYKGCRVCAALSPEPGQEAQARCVVCQFTADQTGEILQGDVLRKSCASHVSHGGRIVPRADSLQPQAHHCPQCGADPANPCGCVEDSGQPQAIEGQETREQRIIRCRTTPGKCFCGVHVTELGASWLPAEPTAKAEEWKR